jgi:anti-sigma factor RsiW
VAESAEDLDILIEQYMDGQMEPAARVAFEERLRKDAALRQRVNDQTRSMDMIKDALVAVTPSDEFDTRVNSKIISITQSKMQPAAPSNPNPLTSQDADARLLGEPDESKEKKRLIAIAGIVLVIFLLGAVVVGYSMIKGARKSATEQQK